MNTNPFQFNRLIDAGILDSLYENDYLYIEEIFKMTLKHYDEDVETFKAHHQAGNLEGLKKATHKIKPVFGYIGMPGIQECCKDFEDKCEKTGTFGEIMPEYEKLVHQFEECKKIIETDLQKLCEYNNKNAE
jgi:HPt (histidine-containing phosphotransfer) domain-containing protein